MCDLFLLVLKNICIFGLTFDKYHNHPVTGEPLLLKARLDDQWMNVLEAFDWVESIEGSSP